MKLKFKETLLDGGPLICMNVISVNLPKVLASPLKKSAYKAFFNEI